KSRRLRRGSSCRDHLADLGIPFEPVDNHGHEHARSCPQPPGLVRTMSHRPGCMDAMPNEHPRPTTDEATLTEADDLPSAADDPPTAANHLRTPADARRTAAQALSAPADAPRTAAQALSAPAAVDGGLCAAADTVLARLVGAPAAGSACR